MLVEQLSCLRHLNSEQNPRKSAEMIRKFVAQFPKIRKRNKPLLEEKRQAAQQAAQVSVGLGIARMAHVSSRPTGGARRSVQERLLERERCKILRNPLTATCDYGTFRPASELEKREKDEK